MQQLETDTVVIAAGTAGLAAAVAAAEIGTRVIVFEKLNRCGGTAVMGSGIFAVESRLQRLKHIQFTREEAFRTYMDYTHWRVNARLISTFVNRSAATVDWLEKMGVEFLDVTSHGLGNFHTQHTVKGPDTGPGSGPGQVGPASAMMKILAERAQQLGVKIFLKTPAQKILLDQNRVTGVLAIDEKGEEIIARARTVIVATGGYGAPMPGLPSVTGDGIRMAREVGADAIEKPAEPARNGVPPFTGRFYTVSYTFQQPNLMVNLAGERFMNEEIKENSVYSGNAIAAQPGRCAFTIFDEATKDYYAESGLDILSGGIQVPIKDAQNFDAELEQIIAGGSDSIFVAKSLEELGGKTGIDLNGLLEAVNEYNKASDTGRDEIFHKKARYLRPVRKPKFYACKNFGSTTNKWYGIKINHKTEVLTSDNRVIPGLYAAGMEVARNIFYDDYPMMLPATAMGFCINSGRMAGENAAKYIQNRK